LKTRRWPQATHAIYTDDPAMLAEADMIIVAVPTPVDEAHIPDFKPLIGSSTSAGRHMKKGVTWSTNPPSTPAPPKRSASPCWSGIRPEVEAGLLCRLQPRAHQPRRQGAHAHQDPEDRLRRHARDAGQGGQALRKDHRARRAPRQSSIKAAEAAKVIENTQRDLNIALMNELAIIFDKIGIDTSEVLEAAGTKWNFLKFKPGLVGGHCIGVDPYYLTHKADMLGYHPQVILAGRRINDGMGKFIAEQTIKHMIAAAATSRAPRSTCWA
jgi:UDP-N-acetyl-D-galactosamine dehydrogenase